MRAEVEVIAEGAAEDAGGAGQALAGGLDLVIVADAAIEDAGDFEVRGHADLGDGDALESRIVQLSGEDGRDFLADQGADTFSAFG